MSVSHFLFPSVCGARDKLCSNVAYKSISHMVVLNVVVGRGQHGYSVGYSDCLMATQLHM